MMHPVFRSLCAVGVLALAAGPVFAAAPAAPAPAPAANPFFSPSPLQYEAPPFDKIKDSDYQPALEEGMKQQIAEIDAIANDPAPPTFENTLVAMEKSGQLLTRVAKVFFNLTQSNIDDEMKKVRAEEAPKLAAHQDAIFLNPKLWARLKTLWEKRETLKLDPESAYLLERYYKTFVRAGANLAAADQTKLKEWNQEEAKLTTDFEERLLAGTKGASIVVSDRAELAGMPETDVTSAANRAKERGMPGKWVIDLQNTTQQPVLAYLTNRALRQRILEASEMRCDRGDANDTKAIVERLAQLRADRAKLLGFPTHAAYVLDDRMAKTPEHALKLMTDMVPAATGKAEREAARMQKIVDAEKGGFKVSAADWELYAEKVRKADYDIDEAQVKPYFELNRVIEDGVFFAAHQLYGLTFKERKDLPVYNPDVRVWEVFDADGKSLALFYGDYFQRSNKSGGAWDDSFVDQTSLIGTHPVIVNVLNFPKPAPGEPALLSPTEVTAAFHEFGHALHGMFSNIKYPTLGSTPRDWVEMPSQFNEHWAFEPTVLAHYAKHHKTGAPIPEELVAKIRKTKSFNTGYMTTEYLGAALLDMAWHTLPPGAPLQKADAFEKEALERYHIAMPQVPPRYRTNYFSHIWDGGYSAGYYAYLWSELLDDDFYFWFKDHGGLTRANGDRFREMVLSKEGTEDVADIFRAFRGRDPIVEPLLEERGLVETPTTPGR